MTRSAHPGHGAPVWKRIIDIGCIAIAAPFWAPVMLGIALWIKAVSRGPVFFRQERIGFRGASFQILKFRSMHLNVATTTHEAHWDQLVRSGAPMTKLDAAGDPRIIPGGRFLRAVGLDEAPQIFNVLRGEMSLVGPRPCTPREFEGSPELRMKRIETPPGLTGYWQVNGKNNTSFATMIALDTHYVENASPGMDVLILIKTIRLLCGQAFEFLRPKTSQS